MKKEDILKIIDDVMNNREIDSIRNAILAIRDKIVELSDEENNLSTKYTAKLLLRGDEMNCTGEYFKGARYFCVDTAEKIDTGIYGAYWYE